MRTLMGVILLCLTCATARAQQVYSNTVTIYGTQTFYSAFVPAPPYVPITNKYEIVRMLAASGDICRVFGHSWKDFDEGMFYCFYAYTGNPTRTCRICGATEPMFNSEPYYSTNFVISAPCEASK